MSGFITIERKLWDHDFFKDGPMSEREAWMWMISNAAWKDTRHRVGSEMLEVPRGSFYCTLRELQSVFGWDSDKRVRTFLKRTQSERMVELNTDAKKTRVSICNYSEYQHSGRKQDASRTQEEDENGRNGDALKEQDNNKQLTRVSKDTHISEQIPPDNVSASDELSQAVLSYNSAADKFGWPKAQKITPARRAAIKARLKEAGGFDGWAVAISKAEESDFLSGRTPNAFSVNLDWISKQSNFTKIMEGNYDNRSEKTGHNKTRNGQFRSGMVDAFADVAADLARQQGAS